MQTAPTICPRCRTPIPADAPGGICPACALLGVAEFTHLDQTAAAALPTLEEMAAAFPELELLELAGQGGMGVVFKARQPRLDRLVALKILPPRLAVQPGFAERFTREARMLARLSHPHIVAIYDFGERAGYYYLLMEFVNGVNLRQAMQAGVTPEQALALVPKVCEALQFAHDRGVLHRDIKPENILLDTAGTPKLADFGIAKMAGESAAMTGLTATGAALGTAAYMAPEQIERPSAVDHRADIYSLGVVLYEMLTGELPLGRFAAPSEKSHVAHRVDEVVMRALEKERERRQQSATEMKTQVEGASGRTGAGSERSGSVARTPDEVRERRGRMLALIGAWIHLVPVILIIANLGTWLDLARDLGHIGSRADEVLPIYLPRFVGIGIVSLLALLAGFILTLFALFGCRYRARWFFWWLVIYGLATVSGWIGIVPLGACLLYYREFFPETVAPRFEPPAVNLWPHRLFWLIVGLFVVPAVAVFSGLLVPQLAYVRNDLGASRGGLMVAIVALLPFLTGALLFFIQRRTRPAFPVKPRAEWNPWPKRIFLLILTLIVLPATLLAAGVVLPMMAYRHLQKPALAKPTNRVAATDVVTTARVPSIAHLAPGTVELVALAAHPSAGQAWWKMDGSPAGPVPFRGPGSTVSLGAGQRAVEFVIRTRDLPLDTNNVVWEVDGSSGGSTIGAPESSERPGERLADCQWIRVVLPTSLNETDIRLGYGVGPWQTLLEKSPRNSTSSSTTHEGIQWEVSAGTGFETKDGNTVVVYQRPHHPGWESRVVAEVENGPIITGSGSSVGDQAEWTFYGRTPAQIKTFHFQVRRLQWVEFRGVALAPNPPPATP